MGRTPTQFAAFAAMAAAAALAWQWNLTRNDCRFPPTVVIGPL